MKGWYNESMRHSLAARGISTRARALVKPSGSPDPRKIKHLTRMERSIKDLGRVLSRGRLDYTDFDIYGGLTTAWPIDEGSNISGMGWVIMTLDPEIILKKNDLIKIDYTTEFFRENVEIGDRVRGNVTAVWEPKELVEYKDEEELVSFSPIIIPPEAVQRVEIHYGDNIPDPITGLEEETSWESGSEEHLQLIFTVIERSIPSHFWDRTYVVGDEGEYRIGDYVK